MKKTISVMAISSMLLVGSMATVNAQSDNPFENLRENEITTTDVAAPITDTMVSMNIEKMGTEKVKVVVSIDNMDLKAKSSKIVLKFPDVVSIEEADIVKGELFDTNTVSIEEGKIIFNSESVTAIPLKWTLLEATFKVKDGTVKQEYPFAIDVTDSKITNELNDDITVKTGGVEMVELETVVPEVKEVKKETGFADNVAILTLLGISSLAFLTNRRKKGL